MQGISRLVTILKFIYAPIWVSDKFALTVCLKLTTFFFQILILPLSKSSTGLTSYIVQIISIWLWFCNHCNLVCFLSSNNFEHSFYQTPVYAISCHNNPDCLWLNLSHAVQYFPKPYWCPHRHCHRRHHHPSFPKLQTYLRFEQVTVLLTSTLFSFLRLNLTISNFCPACLLTDL